MLVKPVFNRVVLVACDEPTSASKSLIIPDVAASALGFGVLSQVSEGLELKAGDKVLYLKSKAVAFRNGSTEIQILDAVDVLAVVCDG